MSTFDVVCGIILALAGSYLTFNAIRIHLKEMGQYVRAYDKESAVSSFLQAVFTLVLYVLMILILAHQI